MLGVFTKGVGMAGDQSGTRSSLHWVIRVGPWASSAEHTFQLLVFTARHAARAVYAVLSGSVC